MRHLRKRFSSPAKAHPPQGGTVFFSPAARRPLSGERENIVLVIVFFFVIVFSLSLSLSFSLSLSSPDTGPFSSDTEKGEASLSPAFFNYSVYSLGSSTVKAVPSASELSAETAPPMA